MGALISMKVYHGRIIYHIIATSIQKGIAIVYCVSSINNMDALRNLNSTLILPHLSYCAMVWGNTYTTNSMPLPQTEKSH